jgi:voltage-gated potassium channel
MTTAGGASSGSGRPFGGDERHRHARRRAALDLALRTTFVVTALTVAYYLFPADDPFGDAPAAARLVAGVASLVLVGLVVRRQLRAREEGFAGLAAVEALLTALYLLVLVFAQVYFRLETASAGQFAGLSDRTDALYFTVTTVTTVGFGDVHAQETAARVLVTVQMLFNFFYLGTALRLLTSRDVWATPAEERGSG